MNYLVVGTLPQLTLPVNTHAQHSCSFRLLLKSSKGSRQPWVALEKAQDEGEHVALRQTHR